MRGCYGDPDDMHGLPGGIDEGILEVMRWNLRYLWIWKVNLYHKGLVRTIQTRHLVTAQYHKRRQTQRSMLNWRSQMLLVMMYLNQILLDCKFEISCCTASPLDTYRVQLVS
ncbi:uncharacterized protein LOC135676850 [Musa acuminata AAA Group]